MFSGTDDAEANPNLVHVGEWKEEEENFVKIGEINVALPWPGALVSMSMKHFKGCIFAFKS